MYVQNRYEERTLEKEEEAYLLQRLLTMTTKGQIHWCCTNFAPVSFMLAEDEQGPDPFLSQLFTVECHLNGVSWELSISESIRMRSGVGEVRVLGEQENGNHRQLEAQYIGEIGKQSSDTKPCADPVVAQLAGAILEQIESSDVALESYTWATFDLIRNTPERYQNDPLYRFGEKLLENKQALAFHQCVVDGSYRQKLLAAM